jgi:hypothetical protein
MLVLKPCNFDDNKKYIYSFKATRSRQGHGGRRRFWTGVKKWR